MHEKEILCLITNTFNSTNLESLHFMMLEYTHQL